MTQTSEPLKVLHLSSVHPYDDTRIRWRYCEASVLAGHEVTLVAPVKDTAASPPPSYYLEVPSKGLGGLVGRLSRIMVVTRAARRIETDVVHIHDPELLLVAPLLRRRETKVIYDAHEDVENQIGLKTWLHPKLRWAAQKAVRLIYQHIEKFVDGVVTADQALVYPFATDLIAVQRNLPRRSEVEVEGAREALRQQFGWSTSEQVVLYLGSINPSRGLTRLADVVSQIALERPIRLVVAGAEFPTPFLSEHVAKHSLQDSVDLLGRVDRTLAAQLMTAADVGSSLLEPTKTYFSAIPTKLYEYAMLGLPILASDFPACRSFIERAGAGVVCDPLNDADIAESLAELWRNRSQYRRQAEEQRQHVEAWETDFTDVVELYDRC